MSPRRIPLNVFGMGFGLAGLATSWRIAADPDLASHWVSDVLAAIATVMWAGSCLAYLRYAVATTVPGRAGARWVGHRLLDARRNRPQPTAPDYFLPTVAGGLVASAGATEVGQPRFAEVMLGLGLVCWAIMGSMILGRLIFRPPLPDALAPTMAIEVAPAAVASVAHFIATAARSTSWRRFWPATAC